MFSEALGLLCLKKTLHTTSVEHHRQALGTSQKQLPKHTHTHRSEFHATDRCSGPQEQGRFRGRAPNLLRSTKIHPSGVFIGLDPMSLVRRRIRNHFLGAECSIGHCTVVIQRATTLRQDMTIGNAPTKHAGPEMVTTHRNPPQLRTGVTVSLLFLRFVFSSFHFSIFHFVICSFSFFRSIFLFNLTFLSFLEKTFFHFHFLIFSLFL